MTLKTLLIALMVVFTWTDAKKSSCNEKLRKSIQYQFDLWDNGDTCHTTGHVKSAFSAQLRRNLINPAQHKRIEFETVRTNVGGNYDKTGIYTAPRDGTYFFTWTIQTNTGGWCITEIVLNGNTVGFANHTNSNKGSNVNKTSSQSVVLVLKKNDRVWIRMERKGAGYCYEGKWNSFSGFEI